MEHFVFSWSDYIIFVVMLTATAFVGIYFGYFNKKQTTLTDYFYGGKNMNVWPVAISTVAGYASITVLLAYTTEIYMYGTQSWVRTIPLPLMAVAVNYVYLPVFYKLQLDSPYEYFELRFDKSVRKLAALCFLIPNVLMLPVLIYSPSIAFSQVSGISIYIIIPVISIICIFYTSIGGLKAVVWTDTLQFIVTIACLLFTFVMGIVSLGGFSYIWNKAEEGSRIEFFNMDPDPTVRATFWNVFICGLTTAIAFNGTHPAGLQRFLSLPTISDSKKLVVWIYAVLMMISDSILCFSGLLVYAKYYDCDPLSAGHVEKPDQILIYYVLSEAKKIPGLAALFIAGLSSMGLSALSTWLNVISCMVYTDIVAPFMPGEAAHRQGASIKLITGVIGVSSIGMAYVIGQLGSLMEILCSIFGIALGPIMGLFTMAMIFPFVNTKGALSGGIVSIVIMLWLIIETQIHVFNGSIVYPTKPLETYGCNITSNNLSNDTLASPRESSEELFWFVKISFYYYVLIGFIVCMVCGVFVSLLTKNKQPVDRNLLSPVIYRFLPKQSNNDKKLENLLNS